MLPEWLAQERYQDRMREIEHNLCVHEALARGSEARTAGTPIRVRVGRWLIASGQRLVQGA